MTSSASSEALATRMLTGSGWCTSISRLCRAMSVAENFALARAGPFARRRLGPPSVAGCTKFLKDMPFQGRSRGAGQRAGGRPEAKDRDPQAALISPPAILILDEPTSVLTPGEARRDPRPPARVARGGRLSVLMITHKLREVVASPTRSPCFDAGGWSDGDGWRSSPRRISRR